MIKYKDYILQWIDEQMRTHGFCKKQDTLSSDANELVIVEYSKDDIFLTFNMKFRTFINLFMEAETTDGLPLGNKYSKVQSCFMFESLVKKFLKDKLGLAEPLQDKRSITTDIKYVGVNDHQVDLFEGQYIVPNGMAYNSYVIQDDKIAVMDTVDINFKDEWLANIKEVLGTSKPDYLIIQHMEPDHSANIKNFLEEYPDTTLVGNQKTFVMMDQFFQLDASVKRLVVNDKDTLELGAHTLTFVFAPMVHWPEVMVTYDNKDKVLFSADGFGKFGALDVEEDWDCEARRYYFGIVGKYGMQVQKLLKTAAELDIETICPLHGPVLTENLEHYIGQYDTWSSYRPENEGVLIAYASVYGNTRQAAELLAKKLEEKGCPKVVLADLAREDMAECVEDAFRYDKLVLASVTYNADVFPCMKTFIYNLLERNYQNRTIAFMENGSWAPTANHVMQGMFEKSKDITFAESNVTIKSAVNVEVEASIEKLATELTK